MSLESEIKKLVEALEANTTAVNAHKDALGNAPSGDVSPASAEDTPEGTPKKTSASKSKSSSAKASTAKKTETKKEEPADDSDDSGSDNVPSEMDVRQAFGGFLKIDEGDEREARKAFVKKLLKKFGAERATEIDEGDRSAAIEAVQAEQAKRENAEEEEDLV